MTEQPQDPPGTRSIRLEVEVPGTPEEVWEAIASGPGITAWFVPATVEGREGGTVTMSFGPGMEESGTVQAWDPPHRSGTAPRARAGSSRASGSSRPATAAAAWCG